MLPNSFNKAAFARAVQKLFTAASAAMGADCYSHALVAKAALSSLGISAELRSGFAAWRVDSAAHAVIAHHPEGEPVYTQSSEKYLYHTWLNIGTDYVDFTTYQLRKKARTLDAIDNLFTPVSWCPNFLWVHSNSVSTFTDVRDGISAGLYHYSLDSVVESKARAYAAPVNTQEVQALLHIYALELTGGVNVIGPNTPSVSPAISRLPAR